MELSIFLAKVLGLYFIIIIVAVCMRRAELERVLKELSENRLFSYSSGALLLLLGLSLVIIHPVWEASWRGVITLLGWITVAKGIIRLFFLDWVVSMARVTIKSSWYGVVMIVFGIIGVWLAYKGFTL